MLKNKSCNNYWVDSQHSYSSTGDVFSDYMEETLETSGRYSRHFNGDKSRLT